MPEIRYRIPLLSAQAILAYAKINERFPDRYTVALNKRETESTVIRGGETYQADNAIFYQAMCAIHNYEYTAPTEDTVIEDLYDVIAYVDFKGIIDRDDTNPKVALRQKKAESMFRGQGIKLDFGKGQQNYVAFERSASMSRNARLAFIREDMYSAVHSRMTLDMRIRDCQLSKLYAYNGLMFSSGTRIEAPFLWNEHSIVVIDNPTDAKPHAKVITVKDVTGEGNVRKYERIETTDRISITEFDGEGLISKEFSKYIDTQLCGRHIHHSYQIRMPYIKGMVHEVDFRTLLMGVGIQSIKDVWGNEHPINEVHLILTKSQLKGFGWLEESGYHWYKYLRVCEKYGHALYVTGISKDAPEEYTELNYQFLNTVSMKTELFRPDDLPLGWEHSPAEEEREWLTKATEQRYYDLCANDYFRQRYFISRAERWSFRKKSKNYRMAQILKKNPLFIHEAYFTSELDALAENVLKNYAVGKLLIEGDNRYLSGDLMQFLLNLIMPYRMVSPDAVKLCRTLLDESFSGTADFYAPGAVYTKQERYTLLRNPHIARNEEAMVKPIEKVGYMRDRCLSHLTDVVMVGSTSLIAERLGGADYDGDMVKTIAEPILNDCVFQNYDTDKNDFDNNYNLPLLKIPSATSQIQNANNWRARFQAIKNTFSSRVGQISNAALDRSIIAYDENADAETKERCRQETETLAILTGLEIDSAKSGIKPDLSEYLGTKNIKRSNFLKYKRILDESEERRAWYEPTFEERFKEYFAKTDWDAVSSNLEKLPYYAYMLKKHTPKAKRKPAKASELFTFATVEGWENTLNPNTLERIKELIDTYDSCLRRIRASAHLPKAQSKKNGINRIFYLRDEENKYDADELYSLFVNLSADRVSEIRRAIREEKWQFMPEEQRTLFLHKYLPEDEFIPYYDLFADFRSGGYRLLGDLIIDTDNENITQNRARLRFDNDTPEMVALIDAFIDKEFGVDYRDAVAARCLDLVKKICNPSDAVKYVVALNKRSFLWDVLWEYVEKFALKK